MAWWESCGYRSRSLPSSESEEEEDDEEREEEESSVCTTDLETTDIHYVLGDVTHPQGAQGDAIIIHCVGTKHGFRMLLVDAESQVLLWIFGVLFFR